MTKKLSLRSQPKVIQSSETMIKLLIFVGNSVAVIGCLGLVLSLFGIIEAEFFSFGISSGVRIIGSVAIAGCLLSAIGYGVLEYFEK